LHDRPALALSQHWQHSRGDDHRAVTASSLPVVIVISIHSIKTNSTFTSPDISQEGQEVQSNNDGTNGSVIRSHHENLLEDYMVENLKDTTTNATTKDMKDTTTNGHTNLSTTESVETVGVQSSALGRTSKETTKE
jgi:hypothetical protein